MISLYEHMLLMEVIFLLVIFPATFLRVQSMNQVISKRDKPFKGSGIARLTHCYGYLLSVLINIDENKNSFCC